MKTLLMLLLFASCSAPFKVSKIREPAQDINQGLLFLDSRAKDWLDTVEVNGNPCLSCHTTMPYAMVRPAHGQSEELDRIKNVIEKRVNAFEEAGFNAHAVPPWYDRTKHSYSNEAVLNAVTMIYMDKGVGEGTEKLSDVTKKALDQMWSFQIKSGDEKGGFLWLDHFDLKPFEARGGEYWGASMVAIAVAEAPEEYAKNPLIQDKLVELRKYLKKELNTYSTHEKLMALWADDSIGGILSSTQKKGIIDEVLSLQKEGGWSIHSLLGVEGMSHAPDGYATGLVTNVLLKAGKKDHPKVRNGLKWIRESQVLGSTGVLPNGAPGCGSWMGMSPNSHGSSVFFTDISTSYAILTLRTASKLGL